MSAQTRLQVTLISSLLLVLILGIAVYVFFAWLTYIFIGAALLALLAGGIVFRRQHLLAQLPLRAHELEEARLAQAHELERERLALERERLAVELRLAQEKHTMELQVLSGRWQLEQHVTLTRVLPDERGHYPYIVTQAQDGQYYQHLPNPHMQARIAETASASASALASSSRTQQDMPISPAPTIDSIVAQLPYNELMTAYGVTLRGGKLITASIPDAVHFKLVGGSGFGKSCEAAALLRIATMCNDADHLQIALLDLERKTSRLFEGLPHVATIHMGRKSVLMAMSEPSADEVAHKLAALVYELQRRAARNVETPILLIYVEEMLSLRYEVDEALLDEMLANLAILAVRGRKYGMFLEACTQADYSTQELKVAQKQFRSRIAFAIDPTAARASGFVNTDLIKQNFQTGQPGQFVLERPGQSELMIAPQLDVKQELRLLEVRTSNRRGVTSQPVDIPTSMHPHLQVVESQGSTGGKRVEVEQEDEGSARSHEPLSEKAQAVASLIRQRKSQNDIIAQVWGITGGGRAYQAAMEEYREIVAQLLERGA